MSKYAPVIDRFIELSVIEQYRQLDETEKREKKECLQILTERQWKLSKLKNLSFIAYLTKDVEWPHEICSGIEEVGGI